MNSIHRWTLGLSIPAFVVLICAVFAGTPARAQSCDRALCRSGEQYTGSGSDRIGAYGVCESSSGLGYKSHYLARCEEGSTLNPETGRCVLDACAGGGVCGALLPLCDSGERYARSERDSEGVYGVCEHGPAPFTLARSHTIKRCRDGWTLQEATGLCRRDCLFIVTTIDPGLIFTFLRPDLTIRRTWLRSPTGAVVSSVPLGGAYHACFEVANVGSAASGPFRVDGGGLGVRTPPSQAHASLDAGAAREACLAYPSTPQAGTFSLGLKVDSLDTVDESNEDNNTATIRVVVRP